MLTSTWQRQLKQILIQVISAKPEGRIAFLGIGNELNGDDGAGILAAGLLHNRFSGRANILVVQGGSAPENFSAPIRRFSPDLLLMVDAAEMGAKPGMVACLHSSQSSGYGASTHSLPPTTLAKYIMEQTGCQVTLIAIQVKQLELGSSISPSVRKAVFALDRVCGEALNLID